MSDLALEPLLDLFWVVAYGLITTLLTTGGILVERAGLSTFPADTTLGLWMAGLGAVLLGGAYLVATDRFLPTLRTVRA
ncbi:hypothetical protein ACFPYI_09360 [Halomarina salina]|uniref:DUF8151 domain-containing protein n=1 Tax=Halomarina salina TaxID=1872699 RepID=A0ABD5RMF9_9EURY|nr:hypothetical protein [Halomarina salina]